MHFNVLMHVIGITIASIWCENKLEYLSLDIICSLKLTVFLLSFIYFLQHTWFSKLGNNLGYSGFAGEYPCYKLRHVNAAL